MTQHDETVEIAIDNLTDENLWDSIMVDPELLLKAKAGLRTARSLAEDRVRAINLDIEQIVENITPSQGAAEVLDLGALKRKTLGFIGLLNNRSAAIRDREQSVLLAVHRHYREEIEDHELYRIAGISDA